MLTIFLKFTLKARLIKLYTKGLTLETTKRQKFLNDVIQQKTQKRFTKAVGHG